jgi:hypothetical protein
MNAMQPTSSTQIESMCEKEKSTLMGLVMVSRMIAISGFTALIAGSFHCMMLSK